MLGAGVVPDGHGDPRALERALIRLGRMAQLPGLVAVVSDFRGTDGLARPLRLLCGRHSVAAVEVRDPREAELPAVGRLLVTDPETGSQLDVDARDRRLRERYAERERAGREAVRAELRTAGADHVVLTTDAPWLRDLGGRLKALGGRRT
jgi:uncharacterized protein (DUF58 family)